MVVSACAKLPECDGRGGGNVEGIYLMEHTDCPAILIECGFLSNQKEANQLQDKIYQKMLCKVIIATISCYINGVDREVLR